MKKLANSQATLTTATTTSTINQEERNRSVVKALYEAFNSQNDINIDPNLFACYLEWWFHGPPSHQHLKRLLTGSSPNDLSFPFNPLSIVAFESTVIAEGCDEDRSVSWVHAWTLGADGIITHVREYYNTSVTVTRLGRADVASQSVSSPEITSHSAYKCQSVWQSKLCDASVP
ncbi:NTF2-like domain containing protein, partial [Parasponia andersonii]